MLCPTSLTVLLFGVTIIGATFLMSIMGDLVPVSFAVFTRSQITQTIL